MSVTDTKKSLAQKQGWSLSDIALARGYTPPISRETLHLPEKAKRGRPKTRQQSK